MSDQQKRFALCLLGLAGLLCHAAYFYPFFSDDALISLRYSQRLLAGEGLTYTSGERVEGYTNLLWVLSVAFLGNLGVELILAARLLGLAAAALCFFALITYFRKERFASAAAAIFLLASSAPFAGWAIGGMEQIGLAALLSWALLRFRDSAQEEDWARQLAYGPGLFLALAVLLRADGAVFCAAFLLAALLESPRLLRPRVAGILLLPLLAYTGQLAFRLSYYGDWVPNTARAKLSLTGARLESGLSYLLAGLLPLALILLLAAYAAPRSKKEGHTAWIVSLVWLVYVLLIGGDIFPGFRHFVPILPLLCVLAAPLLARAWAHGTWRWQLACLGIFVLNAWWQNMAPEMRRLKEELWVWEGQHLGQVLKRNFGEQQALLAVDAAGALPYWSELPTLDMLGLNDRYLALHPPPGFGQGQIGHELGDGAYLWHRRPDIIMACGSNGSQVPCFASFGQLYGRPEFWQSYQFVVIKQPQGLLGLAYFLRESPKVGIRRSEERIAIPAYFFANSPPNVAQAGPDGLLEVQLQKAQAAHFQALPLPAGVWSIDTDTEDRQMQVAISCGTGMLHQTLPLLFKLDSPRTLDLSLQSGSLGRPFKQVLFTRHASDQNATLCISP